MSFTAGAALPTVAYSPDGFHNAVGRFFDGSEPDWKLIQRGLNRDKPALIARGVRRLAKDYSVLARWLRDHEPNACQARPTEIARGAAFRVARNHRLEAKAVERRAWASATRHLKAASQAHDVLFRNVERIYDCAS